MKSPDYGSLSELLKGKERVRVLSGSISPSLPNQSFHVEDRLAITMNAFGRDGREQRAWRREVPPDVLADLERAFPTVIEYSGAGRVPDEADLW